MINEKVSKLINSNYFLVVLSLINLLICLIYLLGYSKSMYVPWHEYTDIAVNIAAGNGYRGTGFFKLFCGPTAFLMPIYSYLLAFFIYIFKLPTAYLMARCFNALINIAILLMIYKLAEEIYDKRVGVVSAAIFSIYLPFVFWTYEVWDTLLFSLILLVSVYLTLIALKKNKWPIIISLGISLGLSILINAISAVLVPFLLGYYMLNSNNKPIEAIREALIVLLLIIVIVIPWSYRNCLAFKTFIPLRTGLWLNLYLGNNPDSTGTVYLKYKGRVCEDYNEGITRHFRPMISSLMKYNEYDQDQYLKDKFKQYIVVSPLEFSRLLLKKAYYFWWFNPFEKTHLICVYEYALVLLLALCATCFDCFKKKRAKLILILFFTFTIIYVLTGPFFNWKYRLPIEPYLIILAAYSISKLFKVKTLKS